MTVTVGLLLVNVVGIDLITVSRWFWTWQLGSFSRLSSLVILVYPGVRYYCRCILIWQCVLEVWVYAELFSFG